MSKSAVSETKPTAIDLFSGCGGTSEGLKKAGFNVVAAVEIDRKAQETYVLNHRKTLLYKQDIREIDPLSVLAKLKIKPGEIDLIAGCPPCQGFSRLRTKNQPTAAKDARNDLIFEFYRFVHIIRPKTIMLENVPALERDHRFEELRNKLEHLGYHICSSILDAADYRVPQRRRRLILLGSRLHSPHIAKITGMKMTVRQALNGMEAPSRSKDKLHSFPERRSQAVKALIAQIPKNGGSRSMLSEEYQLECHKRYAGFYDVYGRMKWDDVAPTITSGCHNPSKGRFLHPSRNRTITLREAAILQGFPRTYAFDVSHGKESIALMIGNALPPPFITVHANTLKQAIRSTKP